MRPDSCSSPAFRAEPSCRFFTSMVDLHCRSRRVSNLLGAIWSPDAKRVFFASNRGGGWAADTSIPSDGNTLEPQLIQITPPDPTKDAFSTLAPVASPGIHAERPSPIGRRSGDRRNARCENLVTVPTGGGKTEDFVRTEYVEDAASVSPDGRFVAYRSTQSGRSEIWVRAAAGSAPVRVSQSGGREPLWSRDGRELLLSRGEQVDRADRERRVGIFIRRPCGLFRPAVFPRVRRKPCTRCSAKLRCGERRALRHDSAARQSERQLGPASRHRRRAELERELKTTK